MGIETAFEVGRLYLQLKRIADILTGGQRDLFVKLPGLMGYWPMGIRAANGNVAEHAGLNIFLGQTGVCPTGFDGDSYVQVGNGTNFLSTSADLSVTGLETFIDATLRGLTVGGWFKVDTSPGITSGLASRDGSAPQRGYNLTMTSGNLIQFVVSGNGTALDLVQSAAVAIGEWVFVAGRFTPSTELAVWTNGTKEVSVSGIPASVNASTQDFEVGRAQAANSRIITAKVRDLIVCAAALPDDLIEDIRLSSAP